MHIRGALVESAEPRGRSNSRAFISVVRCQGSRATRRGSPEYKDGNALGATGFVTRELLKLQGRLLERERAWRLTSLVSYPPDSRKMMPETSWH
jgi:hypothetical protein